jgi:hypothetical protein
MMEAINRQAEIDPESKEFRMPAPKEGEEGFYRLAQQEFNRVLRNRRAKRDATVRNEVFQQMATT